jgi:retinol dehydrogenase-14
VQSVEGNGSGQAMRGKVCVVAGASGGIGRATATGLAAQGASVVVVGHDRARGEAAVADIRAQTGNDAVELVLTDLASQESIRELGRKVESGHGRADVLVNNAHIHHTDRVLTEDGVDATFAVTYLSYFLLTNVLLDALKRSAPARVVNVADDPRIIRRTKLELDTMTGEHDGRYSGLRVHNQAKKSIFLFTFEAARRLEGAGVTVNCMFPGRIDTGLKGDVPRVARFAYPVAKTLHLLKPPEEGADTAVYLASSPEVQGLTGKFFVNRKPTDVPPALDDPEASRSLWEASERMIRVRETV